ncbi:MAG: demethoxyubiquinone hydroxylase family protein [Alphaproteobacteria bacterium]|nr:demethoxyubiquinone hydroxylase family protein [Alphaproteobacteria bacterium]
MSYPAPTHRILPGDPGAQEFIARTLRVNQAGEYGAKRIYEGQLAVLKHHASAPVIRHMAEQEQRHLDVFNQMIAERRVRPTLLTPLWHVAGYALGAATALMGEKAAMACTVAVESVIDAHYAHQNEQLGTEEQALRNTIEEFRKEEVEHRDTGLAHKAEETPFYEALTGAIRAGTKLAIWLSKRV